jgi:hypothetical protein
MRPALHSAAVIRVSPQQQIPMRSTRELFYAIVDYLRRTTGIHLKSVIHLIRGRYHAAVVRLQNGNYHSPNQ